MKNILFLISLFSVLNSKAQQGTLDSSFGTNGATLNNNNGSCNAVALQHSGRIIACGAGIVNNVNGLKLVGYTTSGIIDSTFGTNGYNILDYNIYGIGEFFCLTVLQDDKIIAAGDIKNNVAIVKFTADGKLDSSFGNAGIVQTDFGNYESIFALQIQTDSKIVVAGEHSPDFYDNTGLVVRYFPDGELDEGFGNNGEVNLPEAIDISSLAIQKDGKILAGGITDFCENEFYIGRLNEDGSYDKSFGDVGYVYTRFSQGRRDQLRSLAIQPDGKILAAGISNIYFSDQDMGVARYNTDGSLDSSFDTDGLQSITITNNAAEASTVLLQKDGKIILSGDAFNNDPTSGNALIVRLAMNGSLDSSFGENGVSITSLSRGSDVERGAILQTDGKIVVAGTSGFGNMNYDNIARFNNNDETQRQIIITKIRHWLQHHNGIQWDNVNGATSYIIQRSYDGIHFNSVARINSNNQSNLTYQDPMPLSGTNYYRLQTTSINGAVNYSNVLAVTNNDIKISPNPATNSLHVEGLSSNQKTKLTVVDIAGNIKLQAVANASSYNLNIASLTTGNYLLKIETDGEVVSKKFVKE